MKAGQPQGTTIGILCLVHNAPIVVASRNDLPPSIRERKVVTAHLDHVSFNPHKSTNHQLPNTPFPSSPQPIQAEQKDSTHSLERLGYCL
ncbi:hypothetical protein BDZ91DRAFT_743194 [Kalaharituber pfeilii]|nr:hypothetical protein BDZ91DRAFT_743194 [Kalaharituber pfeilii]